MKSSKNVELMVADLILKYPKGSDSKINRSEYTEEEVYIDWEYKTAVVCNNYPLFKYNVELYASLNFIAKEVGLKKYLMTLYPEAGTRKISRRYNLLSYRMQIGYTAWQKDSNKIATWKVDSNAPFPVYVIASNKASASLLAKTMLSSNGLVPSYVSATKYAPGDAETLAQLTLGASKSIEKNIKYIKDNIDTQQKRLDALISLSENLGFMGKCTVRYS